MKFRQKIVLFLVIVVVDLILCGVTLRMWKGEDGEKDFKGDVYHERNKEENIKVIEDLAYEIGFKRVRRITPEFHDEMIGFTSQLPHAMAVALINSDEEGRDTGSFIGDSYRDLTRIANINEDLWSELFLGNKDNLLKAINNFELQLDLIKKAIYDNDKEALKEYFIKSTKRREKLNK